jgi:hypothetical protein
MDVPLTVSVDEFRVADILVFEKVRVLLGDAHGNPNAISPLFFGVVDGEFEPPRRENRVLVVFDGDAAVAEAGVCARLSISPVATQCAASW